MHARMKPSTVTEVAVKTTTPTNLNVGMAQQQSNKKNVSKQQQMLPRLGKRPSKLNFLRRFHNTFPGVQGLDRRKNFQIDYMDFCAVVDATLIHHKRQECIKSFGLMMRNYNFSWSRLLDLRIKKVKKQQKNEDDKKQHNNEDEKKQHNNEVPAEIVKYMGSLAGGLAKFLCDMGLWSQWLEFDVIGKNFWADEATEASKWRYLAVAANFLLFWCYINWDEIHVPIQIYVNESLKPEWDLIRDPQIKQLGFNTIKDYLDCVYRVSNCYLECAAGRLDYNGKNDKMFIIMLLKQMNPLKQNWHGLNDFIWRNYQSALQNNNMDQICASSSNSKHIQSHFYHLLQTIRDTNGKMLHPKLNREIKSKIFGYYNQGFLDMIYVNDDKSHMVTCEVKIVDEAKEQTYSWRENSMTGVATNASEKDYDINEASAKQFVRESQHHINHKNVQKFCLSVKKLIDSDGLQIATYAGYWQIPQTLNEMQFLETMEISTLNRRIYSCLSSRLSLVLFFASYLCQKVNKIDKNKDIVILFTCVPRLFFYWLCKCCGVFSTTVMAEMDIWKKTVSSLWSQTISLGCTRAPSDWVVDLTGYLRGVDIILEQEPHLLLNPLSLLVNLYEINNGPYYYMHQSGVSVCDLWTLLADVNFTNCDSLKKKWKNDILKYKKKWTWGENLIDLKWKHHKFQQQNSNVTNKSGYAYNKNNNFSCYDGEWRYEVQARSSGYSTRSTFNNNGQDDGSTHSSHHSVHHHSQRQRESSSARMNNSADKPRATTPSDNPDQSQDRQEDNKTEQQREREMSPRSRERESENRQRSQRRREREKEDRERSHRRRDREREDRERSHRRRDRQRQKQKEIERKDRKRTRSERNTSRRRQSSRHEEARSERDRSPRRHSSHCDNRAKSHQHHSQDRSTATSDTYSSPSSSSASTSSSSQQDNVRIQEADSQPDKNEIQPNQCRSEKQQSPPLPFESATEMGSRRTEPKYKNSRYKPDTLTDHFQAPHYYRSPQNRHRYNNNDYSKHPSDTASSVSVSSRYNSVYSPINNGHNDHFDADGNYIGDAKPRDESKSVYSEAITHDDYRFGDVPSGYYENNDMNDGASDDLWDYDIREKQEIDKLRAAEIERRRKLIPCIYEGDDDAQSVDTLDISPSIPYEFKEHDDTQTVRSINSKTSNRTRKLRKNAAKPFSTSKFNASLAPLNESSDQVRFGCDEYTAMQWNSIHSSQMNAGNCFEHHNLSMNIKIGNKLRYIWHHLQLQCPLTNYRKITRNPSQLTYSNNQHLISQYGYHLSLLHCLVMSALINNYFFESQSTIKDSYKRAKDYARYFYQLRNINDPSYKHFPDFELVRYSVEHPLKVESLHVSSLSLSQILKQIEDEHGTCADTLELQKCQSVAIRALATFFAYYSFRLVTLFFFNLLEIYHIT